MYELDKVSHKGKECFSFNHAPCTYSLPRVGLLGRKNKICRQRREQLFGSSVNQKIVGPKKVNHVERTCHPCHHDNTPRLFLVAEMDGYREYELLLRAIFPVNKDYPNKLLVNRGSFHHFRKYLKLKTNQSQCNHRPPIWLLTFWGHVIFHLAGPLSLNYFTPRTIQSLGVLKKNQH